MITNWGFLDWAIPIDHQVIVICQWETNGDKGHSKLKNSNLVIQLYPNCWCS